MQIEKLSIDAMSVNYAFIAITHSDVSKYDLPIAAVVDFNRRCQPRLWEKLIEKNNPDLKFVTFSVDAGDNGFPDVYGCIAAMEKNGLPKNVSLVYNEMYLTFDKGVTQSKVYVGFAFSDEVSKIYLPEKDSIVPL